MLRNFTSLVRREGPPVFLRIPRAEIRRLVVNGRVAVIKQLEGGEAGFWRGFVRKPASYQKKRNGLGKWSMPVVAVISCFTRS
jgi:hypothetical protein